MSEQGQVVRQLLEDQVKKWEALLPMLDQPGILYSAILREGIATIELEGEEIPAGVINGLKEVLQRKIDRTNHEIDAMGSR